MNLNWMVMVIVFVFTLAFAVLSGNYLPKTIVFMVPVAGGLIAGYLVGGNYTDGIVSGGIPAGLAGLVYTAGIPGFIYYLCFGALGGLIGFMIKERKIIIQILS